MLRGAYSHLGCHLVRFDPLVWDRHPSFISYNFSSGRPQCPLLLDLHLFELLKTVGVLDIVADERAAARPSLNRQHKAGFALLRLKTVRSHMLLMV